MTRVARLAQVPPGDTACREDAVFLRNKGHKYRESRLFISCPHLSVYVEVRGKRLTGCNQLFACADSTNKP